ncbi:Fur family transcriptional regulator [Undibacterium curvum]|uniref:Fur family transcriptional regulator n=1 Tax=Undibacterium curvum TaxID=2762294 RepID=UPI003D0F8FBD
MNRSPLQLAQQLLETSGIRNTDARRNVLTMLLGASRALTHLEVQEDFPDMDRVTLYRTLDCLTEAGLIHKISGDDRVFRYSASHEAQVQGTPQQHQHGHFKCTRCTRVFCLTGTEAPLAIQKQLRLSLQATLGSGFQSHEIELTIKGWCAACAQT